MKFFCRIAVHLPHNFSAIRFYSARGLTPNSLYARLSPLGNPKLTIVPELDRWLESGKHANISELHRIIRDLRKRRRFSQALEVSEWMAAKGICQLSSGDHAVQLDLMSLVHGLDSAEVYFCSLKEEDKNGKTYGALLNCYVREKLTEKSLSHFHKMKELGFVSGTLPYNNIMCLYTNTNQYEKIPSVLAELQEDKVMPDSFSYRICMNSYGARSDVEGMEMVLHEMENQLHITMDWKTYATIANVYMKAGLSEKAASALKKSEDILLHLSKGDLRDGYNHLISLYGNFGSYPAVQELWIHQKKTCKRVNNHDYIVMLGALVKLKKFDEAESLLKDWEVSGNYFDFRVPDVLLIGYCRTDMLEKAEALLGVLLNKGKAPIPNTFAALASGFVERGCMEKAFTYMKKAIASYPGNEGWRPRPAVLKSLLDWLGDEGNFGEVESFEESLRGIISVERYSKCFDEGKKG